MRKTGIQEIEFDVINEVTHLKEHQEFLYKLLTSKDSFIRKRIIDQNISYLNHRLAHYLDKLGLPHDVKFASDLGVEITEMALKTAGLFLFNSIISFHAADIRLE